MQRNRRIDAGRFQNRGTDIDRHHQILAHLTWPDFARPTHDHGDANATVVEELFAANMATSVIADEEDDGIVGQSLGFQFSKFLPYLTVQLCDFVIILSPIMADFLCIGMICREMHLCRIMFHIDGFVE